MYIHVYSPMQDAQKCQSIQGIPIIQLNNGKLIIYTKDKKAMMIMNLDQWEAEKYHSSND
jgi:hypothetical protein